MKNSELTHSEKRVVGTILKEAKRCLVLNDASGEYEDDGSFIMTLDKEDMEELTRAIDKT